MAYAIDDNRRLSRRMSLTRTSPAPWGEALLAGLPHLLYAVSAYGFQLLALQPYRTNGYQVHPTQLVFWGMVLIGLAYAWRDGWRRWSATWIGYSLVFLAEILLVLPTTGLQAREDRAIFLGVLWILLALFTLVWTARRDWLDGFLAVLPLFPMWYSLLALDGVIGNEAPLFYAVGLLVAAIVAWIVRQGNPFKGMAWILMSLSLVGLLVSYATVYFSNIRPPVGQPPAPTPEAVISSFFLFLLGYGVISCPVWVTAIVRWRSQQRN